MDRKPLYIANAQAFWGDRNSAAATLLKQMPEIDYLTFDYLAEVSLSIMAIQRAQDPSLGYARDFLEVITSLIPFWKSGSRAKVIANAGGLNPQGCAQECKKILNKMGCGDLKVYTVTGDDVLPHLLSNPSLKLYHNLDSDESLETILPKLITANAYLGAWPIIEALKDGADIVITGRVADPSLTVAPAAFHFGWDRTAFDQLASATVAGHLIECGTQVTGGICTDWLNIPSPETIGYPVVEMYENGEFVITKAPGTGGMVNQQIVKEQLLYEIGDPSRYLSPDVTVSFLEIRLTDAGPDRILVKGCRGSTPPDTYKVSATYKQGFRADGMLTVVGCEAVKKARKCGEILLKRVAQAGYLLQHSLIECLGGGDASLGILPPSSSTECVLKVSTADERKEALECFVKEFAPLVTSGAQGTTGYLFGRPKVRPVFGYWPCLIESRLVKPLIASIEQSSNLP
ncbi:MAG: hypothetical protein CK425_05000 [Parachlamydia sp.]|nr:MAG: hypothetical protein CK425_05000 [Parachlamydia sp.]